MELANFLASVGILQVQTSLASRFLLTRVPWSYKRHYAPIAKQFNW